LPHTFQIRSQSPGGTTVAERRSPSQRVLPRPRHFQGRRDRVRALAGRQCPAAAAALAGPAVRGGVPLRSAPQQRAVPRRPPTRPRAGAACRIRAEHLFLTASAKVDPHGVGWTRHHLRHAALSHLAAAGRSATELQAKSCHARLAASGSTSSSAGKPPPGSPRNTTPQHVAAPAEHPLTRALPFPAYVGCPHKAERHPSANASCRSI